MAVNCCVVPFAILGDTGVTAMETSPAAVTVSAVLPETVPIVAAITVLPVPAELANPLVPVALLTVATLVTDELQVTWAVIFFTVPSV